MKSRHVNELIPEPMNEHNGIARAILLVVKINACAVTRTAEELAVGQRCLLGMAQPDTVLINMRRAKGGRNALCFDASEDDYMYPNLLYHPAIEKRSGQEAEYTKQGQAGDEPCGEFHPLQIDGILTHHISRNLNRQ